MGEEYVFELICVGPNFPQESLSKVSNFKYISSFACPSVAFMEGFVLARGRKICFCPDDIILDEGGLGKCLDLLKDKPENHGVTLRYDEGGQSQSSNENYWRGSFHNDQKLPGINPEWKIAPCFMYDRVYFHESGGLNTDMEHVNVNGHSLAFYTQHNGGVLHPSPTRVFQAGWSAPTESTILYRAYLENDAPKFKSFWERPDAVKDYFVDLWDFKRKPHIWPRRYKTA